MEEPLDFFFQYCPLNSYTFFFFFFFFPPVVNGRCFLEMNWELFWGGGSSLAGKIRIEMLVPLKMSTCYLVQYLPKF